MASRLSGPPSPSPTGIASQDARRKTQIATEALAARYCNLVPVVAGTTLGMMLADVAAVFLGDAIAKKVSMPLVHGIAATIFAMLGVLTLFNVGKLF